MLLAREYRQEQHNRPTKGIDILGYKTTIKEIISIIAGIITAYIIFVWGLCGAIIFFAG